MGWRSMPSIRVSGNNGQRPTPTSRGELLNVQRSTFKALLSIAAFTNRLGEGGSRLTVRFLFFLPPL
jgi:hypothetical protein